MLQIFSLDLLGFASLCALRVVFVFVGARVCMLARMCVSLVVLAPCMRMFFLTHHFVDVKTCPRHSGGAAVRALQ